MQYLEVKNFSLQKTIEVGQTFVWKQIDDQFVRLAESLIVVKQEGDRLYIYEGNESEVIRVLGLNDDIEKIHLEINKDSIVSRAIEKGKGLRVVEDGEWIATISFILSIASNINLIKRRIENFSKLFGKKIRYKDKQLYLFPSKEEVLKKDFERLITKEAFGFRYKFLINAIKGTKPNGIGPKVAACIALYGKHRLDEFPIDTWIKRALMIYYPQLYDKNYKKMEKKAKEYFGRYAGYAQLYLYNFIRDQTSTTK